MEISGDTFELLPCAGLCNRLRTIFSYRTRAIENKKKLIVYWEDHSHCAGNIFDNIIKTPLDIEVKSYNEYKRMNSSCNPLKTYDQCCIPNYECIRLTDKFRELYKNAMDILFKGKSYISVHIRRTDFTIDALKRGDYVPDEYFYEFIDTHLKTYPDSLIYLATDNVDTQRIFSDKYKDSIRINPTVGKNRIPGTLRHTTNVFAFLDLCICVSGNDFQGTPKSSFSETIDLMRVQKINLTW
jgi:hypothetical protein